MKENQVRHVVECTYTRPIRSEANPAHIEKALSCSVYLKTDERS